MPPRSCRVIQRASLLLAGELSMAALAAVTAGGEGAGGVGWAREREQQMIVAY